MRDLFCISFRILRFVEALVGPLKRRKHIFFNLSGRMQICVESVCIQRHWLRVSREQGSILHILQYFQACGGFCRPIENVEAYFFLKKKHEW
jgi:hypothetical protein